MSMDLISVQLSRPFLCYFGSVSCMYHSGVRMRLGPWFKTILFSRLFLSCFGSVPIMCSLTVSLRLYRFVYRMKGFSSFVFPFSESQLFQAHKVPFFNFLWPKIWAFSWDFSCACHCSVMHLFDFGLLLFSSQSSWIADLCIHPEVLVVIR